MCVLAENASDRAAFLLFCFPQQRVVEALDTEVQRHRAMLAKVKKKMEKKRTDVRALTYS